MKDLASVIEKVKDPSTKEALTLIAEKLTKIETIPAVGKDLNQVALAVNKITGKL